jgi:transposase
MNPTQRKLTHLEHRRFQGGKMIEQGLRNCEIVGILKCSLSAVKRWRKIVTQQGLAALVPKPRPGRTPKLDERQLAQLKHFLKQGAMSFGHADANWTSRRVCQLIRDQFGIAYSSRQVRRILHKIGVSSKHPLNHSPKYTPPSTEHWLDDNRSHEKKVA